MGAKVGVGTNEKQSAFWIAAGLFSDADFAQARAEALAQNPKLAKRISVQYDGRMYRVLVCNGGRWDFNERKANRFRRHSVKNCGTGRPKPKTGNLLRLQPSGHPTRRS
jgi:phage pi2 protein 07